MAKMFFRRVASSAVGIVMHYISPYNEINLVRLNPAVKGRRESDKPPDPLPLVFFHSSASRPKSPITATLPSASPFSKSPLLLAMQFVTCARHSTGRLRAAANA